MGDKGRVLTGARVRFSLKGKPVGYAKNVTISEEIVYEPVETLDNIEVTEYVPVGYNVRMTASTFRLVGETVKSLGFFPATGQSTEEHLTNILLSGDMTATLQDTKTKKIVSTVQQVKVASRNFSVDARGIVGEDLEFNAIRALDESEVTTDPA